jgi:hypothetical protein
MVAAGSGELAVRGCRELVGEHTGGKWEQQWGLDRYELTISGYPQLHGPSRGAHQWHPTREAEDGDEVVSEHYMVEEEVGDVEMAPDRGWRKLSG